MTVGGNVQMLVEGVTQIGHNDQSSYAPSFYGGPGEMVITNGAHVTFGDDANDMAIIENGGSASKYRMMRYFRSSAH